MRGCRRAMCVIVIGVWPYCCGGKVGSERATPLPAVQRGNRSCARNSVEKSLAVIWEARTIATAPNQCCSMEFMSDKLTDPRLFRTLTGLDQLRGIASVWKQIVARRG